MILQLLSFYNRSTSLQWFTSSFCDYSDRCHKQDQIIKIQAFFSRYPRGFGIMNVIMSDIKVHQEYKFWAATAQSSPHSSSLLLFLLPLPAKAAMPLNMSKVIMMTATPSCAIINVTADQSWLCIDAWAFSSVAVSRSLAYYLTGNIN